MEKTILRVKRFCGKVNFWIVKSFCQRNALCQTSADPRKARESEESAASPVMERYTRSLDYQGTKGNAEEESKLFSIYFRFLPVFDSSQYDDSQTVRMLRIFGINANCIRGRKIHLTLLKKENKFFIRTLLAPIGVIGRQRTSERPSCTSRPSAR